MLNNPINTCFIALSGNRTHGRTFVQDLAERGVGVFILPGHYPEAEAWLSAWPFDRNELVLLAESSTVEQFGGFKLPQVESFILSSLLSPAKTYSAFRISLRSSDASSARAVLGRSSSDVSEGEAVLGQSSSEASEKEQVLEAEEVFSSLDTSDEALLRTHPMSSLDFLQALAAHHRRQLGTPIVGITGTHGKTIVKDWLAQLLGPERRVYASPRSYNSQIGLPLAVWGIRDELHDLAIIEAGISQTGEMERLAHICRPNYGIFTVLGDAHREGFDSPEEQLQEKMKLFTSCEWVVSLHSSDASLAKRSAGRSSSDVSEGEAVLDQSSSEVSVEGGPSLDTSEEALLWSRTHPRSSLGELDLTQLPDLPPPYLRNAHTALAAAFRLGASPEELNFKMSQLSPLANRLQTRTAPNDCLLIDDSYSNDLTSLAAAIEFAASRTNDRKLTVFLSDLLQSGRSPEHLYAEVARILIGRVDRLFLVGESIDYLPKFLSKDIELHTFKNLSGLLKAIPSFQFQQETILLKGARIFGLEELGDRLLQRRHHTRLEIDTGALINNLNTFRDAVNPETILAVMVKASAYGSGDLAVAQLLSKAGVDWFFVAYANEGIALRKGGLKGRILVLNPTVDQLPLLREYVLEPILHNGALLEAALSLSTSSSDEALPPSDTSDEPRLSALDASDEQRLHLELDSGMSRLGFSVEEIPWVIEQLQQAGIGEVGSLMSHLAAAEDPKEDAFSHEQAKRLMDAATDLRKSKIKINKVHLLNSGGIFRHSQYQFDLVRLGIGLYGIGGNKSLNLQPALRLVAPITATRSVQAGQTISYSRNGKLDEAGRIGIVGMGYADGLPRLAGNGRFSFKYGHHLLPTVGNVCMDMCMVDLSTIDIKIGSELIVFGPEHPVELLADAAKTIPYEILTGIGNRVQRIYIGE
ncbi:MAG: alanine racemase [Bacteroidota bacterium]